LKGVVGSRGERHQGRCAVIVSAFLIVAVILFILACVGVEHPRVSMGWLGLAFFALAFLWPQLKLGS